MPLLASSACMLSKGCRAHVKMKATCCPFTPDILYSVLRSSNRLAALYALVMVIWNVYAPANQVAGCSIVVCKVSSEQGRLQAQGSQQWR